MYDSPVSASSESPRPVSPPKRHRALSPALPAAPPASTLPLLPALNGRASPLCSTPEPAAPPAPAGVETAEEGGLSGQELVVAVEEMENGEIGMGERRGEAGQAGDDTLSGPIYLFLSLRREEETGVVRV